MAVQKRKSSQIEPQVSAVPASTPASLLKSGEVSFPRGGASALTPLEVKEVANQAARDVLFEASKSKGVDAEDDDEETPRKKKKVSKKSSKKSSSTSAGGDLEDKDKITIDHLNFRNVTPGSVVLGQVVQINNLDIALALPDNLIGYIPLSNVSAEVTKQIEKYESLSDEENSSDEEDEEDAEKLINSDDTEKELPQTNKLVKVGQWLRALVVEPSEQNKSQKKKKQHSKRIELSVEPELVNDTLEDDDFLMGQTVQASVKSVEDHGLVLNIGKHELSGFLSKKELHSAGYKIEEVTVGAVFLLFVSKKPTNSRVVNLKFNDSGNKPHASVEKISSIDAVVPGNIVEAIVNDVSANGVTCKVFGTINASFNLPSTGVYDLNSLKDRFEIGGKVKAKVIASIVSEGEKKLLLSLLPHILAFKATPFSQKNFDPLEAFPIGFTIEKVTIKAIDSQYLYAEIQGSDNLLGQIHISRIPDKSDLKVKYFVGSTHKAKVLGYSRVDNQYVLTMDPKTLEQKYVRAQDIPVGELFIGTIEKVSGTEGILVKVFDTFQAYVQPKHISDVKLVYPERKYKVGSKVKGRILKITPGSKIFATLKKSLVNNLTNKDNGEETNKLSILSDYSQITVGSRSSGTIEAIFPNGAVVSFFGNVKGFLPKNEISEAFVKNPQEYLRLGHTVSVIVLMVDPKTEKMTVSCKTTRGKSSKAAATPALDNLQSLEAGKSVVQIKIVEKTKDSIIAELKEFNGARGVIYASHLSDGNFEQNRQLLKSLSIGDELETLVLQKDRKARLAILTAKKSLIEDAKSEKLPVDFKDIEKVTPEIVLHGYVKSISDKGLFVGFGDKLVGLVLKKYALKNKADDLNNHYKQHQSIQCHLLRSDKANERFLLALNDTKQKSNKKQITDHDYDFKLQVGETVPAKVRSINDNFLIVELVQRKIGFCYITDALIDYDKSLREAYRPGKVVNAKILSADQHTHKFNVSLRVNFPEDAEVKDRHIATIEDLKSGDVVRGFVKNINDKGVYVSLNADIFALVRVSDLSDQYLKNWKNFFKPSQVVTGRILSVKGEGRILMTLKQSQLSGELKLSKSFDELEVNDIFDGTVRAVTDFGVFVNLENTNGVSGLAHKSQISDDGAVEDLASLFGEGDKVKVKILSKDTKKKQLSLGMKASYFANDEDVEMKADAQVAYDEESENEDDSESEEELINEAFEKEDASDNEDKDEEAEDGKIEIDEEQGLSASGASGLSTNGFDWTASILDQVDDAEDSDDNNDYDEEVSDVRKKNKKNKRSAAMIVEDKTADLNTRAPQSVQDFERLLIGEPSSSVLWMNYMSFLLQLSEIDKAREIGQRALKTINYREEQEKLNIWIALLNLENTFGTDDSLQETFKKACQHMDSLIIHQKLTGIYLLSEKKDEAEQLFKTMTKKFNSEISVWINFGKYYLENNKNEEAHELLAKALQVLPKQDHVEIVKKFGQLEFKIGDPEQGRSLFEGLISDKPKRIDLWNVYIDQEIKQNAKDKVEELFERLVVRKLSNKQKKFFFTKWLQFEEKMEDEKACDYVKAKARAVAGADN